MAGLRVELPPYSMFAKTPIYNIGDGAVVFGLMQDVIVQDPTDQLWPVPSGAGTRLDLVSHRFYGTPELWHIIASVNNCIDPMTGFATGAIIRIPSKTRLAAVGVLNV